VEQGLAKTEGIESEDEAQFFDGDDNDATRGIVSEEYRPKTKKVKTAKGMLISFSTNPGNTAEDGTGSNHSPYTKHLLEQINKPNLQVEMMLKAVQAGVEEATRDPETGKSQVPWYESSIIGSFCFNVVKDGCAKTIVVGIPFLEGVENIEQVELEDGSSYVGQIIGSNTPQGKGVMTLVNDNQIEGEWHSGDISKGKITTTDGGTYEGEIQNRQMHGQGILTSAEVGHYEGEFKNGLMDGSGLQRYLNGELYKGEWDLGIFKSGECIFDTIDGGRFEGQCESGKLVAKGVVLWVDGRRYEGVIVNKERSGQGVMVYSDDSRYKGEFKDGDANGQGVYTYVGGSRYEGEFKDGDANGQGVYTYVGGSRYEGEFKNGRFSGQGVMTMADKMGLMIEGSFESYNGYNYIYLDGELIDHLGGEGEYKFLSGVYYGSIKNGLRNGQGIMNYTDGSKFKGNFIDGLKDGQGVMIYPDGTQFEGEYKNEELNGQGVETHPDGFVYEGEFEDGIRHGRGVMVFYEGMQYAGEFKNGNPNGKGIMTWPTGKSYEGEFKDGLPADQGSYTYPKGVFYEGEWEDDKYSGQGIYVSSLGEQFEGELKNGVPDGWGVETCPSVTPLSLWCIYLSDDEERIRYEVEYVDGKKSEQGVIIFDDGGRYEGKVMDGRPFGKGVIVWSTGKRFEGEWKYESVTATKWKSALKRIVQVGSYTYPDGVFYEGEWEDNKYSGQGIYVWSTGEQFEGELKNGIPDGWGVETDSEGFVFYEGEYRAGEWHGQGVGIQHDGTRWEMIHQNGTLISSEPLD